MRRTLLLSLLLCCAGVQAQPAADAFAGKPDCLVERSGQSGEATAVWSGGCKDGYAEGLGTLQWFHAGKEGDRYEGGLKRGLPHDSGSFLGKDGTLYQGGYQTGKRHGKGIFVAADGRKLAASYEAGMVTGPVVLVFPDGGRYEGAWHGAARDAHGVMQYALGGRYEGNWSKGRREGKGIITYPNGLSRAVEYHEDREIGQPPLSPAEAHRLLSPPDFSANWAWHEVSSESIVPYELPYHELTPAQQRRYKQRYKILLEDDEPPYPVNGSAEIVRALATAMQKLGAPNDQGNLRADVLIDEQGVPVSVRVLEAPGPKVAELISKALLVGKYKPAVCGGTPCSMYYPVSFSMSTY